MSVGSTGSSGSNGSLPGSTVNLPTVNPSNLATDTTNGGFNISGLGSGIDWTSYINAVVNAQQEALAKTLGVQQATLAARQQVIANVKGLVDDFYNSVSGFSNVGDFKTKSVASTAQNVVTATATTQAQNGSFTIDVEKLATNETWQAQFTNVNNSVTSAAGSLTINVRGKNQVINVTAGTTLSQLADQINAANIGVTATVFDTGSGSGNSARLSIVDSTSGQQDPNNTPGVYNLSFTSTLSNLTTAAFGASPIIAGQNAKVFMNGNGADPIYRSSNAITDVIPGVTINLVSANAGVYNTLTTSDNASTAGQKIQDFITKYNNLVSTIQKAIVFNPAETVQSNPTAGDSTLTNVLEQLQDTVTNTVPTLPSDASIKSFTDLGITTNYTSSGDTSNNGTLNFDQSKFNAAVSGNFQGVVEFFEGVKNASGIQTLNEGWSTYFGNIVQSFNTPSTGTLTSRIDGITQQLTDLDKQIQDKSQRIQDNADRMKQQFAELEVTLSDLNSQQSALNSAISALTSAQTQSSSKKSG